MSQEIERKFLIKEFPNLPHYEKYLIKQSYLFTDPFEIRIIKKINMENLKVEYKTSFKDDGSISRNEFEYKISQEKYQELKALVNGNPIIKEYRKYKLSNGRILECSLVDNNLTSSFLYAEVEFDSLEEAEVFNPLEHFKFIKEVTYDDYYRMKNYWEQRKETVDLQIAE